MKLYKIALTALVASAMFASCKKVLQKQDLQSLTPDQVFNDSTIAKTYIDRIYTDNLPSWGGNTGSALGTGETNTEEQYSDNAYMKGTVTQETVGDIATANSKSNMWGKIRSINDFIQGMQSGTIAPATKKRFIAQALFWRAWRYYDFVRVYGGVPIVLTPLGEVGDEARAADLLPRNTTTQTFAQITADLDTAIKYLPAKWPNSLDYGRMTSAAAASFKGRVLMNWASPQFNVNNDVSRWQTAYNANVAAMTILNANGYGLNASYQNMWFTEGYANPEAVMVTCYNNLNDNINGDNNSYDNSTRPTYLATTGGSNQPTWNLALAYDMADGLAPGVSTKYPYTTQTFFDNRDPRFNQTIAYNGCNWSILGNPSYRLWTYIYYTNAAGTGTKSTEATASSTGLYLRKAIDPTISLSNLPYSGTDWIEMRYAEVLLNLGECAAEIGNLGQGQEAYTGLIAIRKRAGIEAGSNGLYGLTAGMSIAQMRTAIMHERQIEFAMEGHRFWDLRRRRLWDVTLNGTKLRLGVIVTLKNTGTSSDYILNTRDQTANTTGLDAMYASSFTVTTKVMDTYNIAIQSADYFFGIPSAALLNNTSLLQNNTWSGTFDPTL